MNIKYLFSWIRHILRHLYINCSPHLIYHSKYLRESPCWLLSLSSRIKRFQHESRRCEWPSYPPILIYLVSSEFSKKYLYVTKAQPAVSQKIRLTYSQIQQRNFDHFQSSWSIFHSSKENINGAKYYYGSYCSLEIFHAFKVRIIQGLP